MRWGFSAMGIVCLAALAAAVACGADEPAQYGPCCPMVKGQKQPATQGTSTKGPRFTCRELKPLSLTFDGVTRQVGALEASDTLLVPARLFSLTGATIEAQGGRKVAMTRGGRQVALVVGDHKVRIAQEGDTREMSWDLCPRRRADVTYVPLRDAAVALGMSVDWKEGAVTLAEAMGEPTVPTETQKPASCPADRVEEALGIKIVRGQASTSLGQGGVEVTDVTDGGAGATMGLRAKDVILEADGKPVTCPKDLDEIIAAAKSGAGAVESLTVARGQEKVKLPAQK